MTILYWKTEWWLCTFAFETFIKIIKSICNCLAYFLQTCVIQIMNKMISTLTSLLLADPKMPFNCFYSPASFIFPLMEKLWRFRPRIYQVLFVFFFILVYFGRLCRYILGVFWYILVYFFIVKMLFSYIIIQYVLVYIFSLFVV
jgi:hypothetical protein